MRRRTFLGTLAASPLAGTPRYPRLPAPSAVWNEEPVAIGFRKQLFVDDSIVSTRHNVTRQQGRPRKWNGSQPLMTADRPWEQPDFGFAGYVSLVHTGSLFRMWYGAHYTEQEGYVHAYAESDDGIHWRKPHLGLHPFPAGSQNKTNNLVFSHGGGFCCSFDPHETDPAHRYKAAYGHKRKICACLAHSPDGLHWTPYNSGEPVTGRASDSWNQILWDEDAKAYRLFTRTDFGEGGGDREYRGTRMMTNPDVKTNPNNWTLGRSWLFDREGPGEVARRQIQNLADWIYEGVHFGLVCVHEWPAGETEVHQTSRERDLHIRPERDVTNLYAVTSRDADRWDLTSVYQQKPLIERGTAGSFDQGMIFGHSSIVTWDDRHWIYYAGAEERHWTFPKKWAIGLATLRLDGFHYLEPWDAHDRGWVITKPFRLEGAKLEINADASGGSLGVEVTDLEARPIQGVRRFNNADGMRLSVNVQPLRGRVVRLKFHLEKAKLFAFSVKA